MKRILAIVTLFCVFGGAIYVINPFSSNSNDGFSVYESVAQGYAGNVYVEVSYDADLTIKSVVATHDGETQGIGTNAIEQLPALIIEANSVDVDIVAGATVTSDAILEAVENTTQMAYLNRTEEVVVSGYASDFSVFVSLSNGDISAIEIGENTETQGIGTNAIEQLPAIIIEANSTEVDVVTGATVTSTAILNAVSTVLGE